MNRSTNGWTLRPQRAVVLLSLRWAAGLLALFVSIYGTTNWIASWRADRLRLWLAWELEIPFVPWMVWPYLSLFAAFLLPMFALDAPAIRVLCRRLATATILSGICFLLVPGELGFERPSLVPGHELAYRYIHVLDLPHNLAPSLHVSWSFILLLALRGASPGWLRRLLELWLVLLITSVLFTHQHHVLDVAGGMLVALMVHTAVRHDGHRSAFQRRTP
jgi:hypothetical protein